MSASTSDSVGSGLFVGCVQRNYPPAKDWAIGSLMFAIGLFPVLPYVQSGAGLVDRDRFEGMFLLPGCRSSTSTVLQAESRCSTPDSCSVRWLLQCWHEPFIKDRRVDSQPGETADAQLFYRLRWFDSEEAGPKATTAPSGSSLFCSSFCQRQSAGASPAASST